MRFSKEEAKKYFKDTFEKIKADSKKAGTNNIAQNYGDILLEKESTDEKTKMLLAKRRREGVRDEDIRWWWNLHDYERRMIIFIDDNFRNAMFIDGLKKGMKPDEAAARVRKYNPMYGDPDDESKLIGEDRPLPEELKERINIYIEKRMITDPEVYKKEIEDSSTFNSLIRKEIKQGNI